MDGGAVTIATVRGIAVRVHRSWIVIAILIAWSFYSRYAAGDHAVVTTIAMATVGTLLFFGSVLVHELAHSLEAQHRGVEVRGITLFIFGGATETSFDVERPGDEFALTAVGPFSSLVLGGAFGLVAYYGAQVGLDAVAGVAGTLGWINVALAVFNLLPGAPLDGGRILRSAVWAVSGDRGRAVRVASRTGQVIGYLLAGLGLFQLFFVPGGLVGGIWLAFIGWFLAHAAKSELVQQELKGQLEGLTVGELVTDDPLPGVDAAADLAAAGRELKRRPEDALAVTGPDGAVSLLLLDDVAGVPAAERPERRAGDVATPLEELRTVPADAEIADTLQAVGGDQPIVVTNPQDETQVIGIVTPERLGRVVRRTMQLGGPPSITEAGPAAHIPGEDGR